MKTAFVTGVAIIAFASVGCATTPAEAVRGHGAVSVCEVQTNREALLDQEILIEGYIERSQHGMFASAEQCPREYIWVVLRDKSDAEAMKTLLRNTNDEFGEPAGDSIFRARVAMNEYKLPLTDHVSPRLSLEFISFVGEKP
ncbi:hypothetical protein K3172_01260 [Qipengyuania sp. 6B39]|uniref:hypothetical protein n=1 Tax=Qipengyuania proteolytica TaxID=2867239 RepID=UPI001C89BE08|nr:hypothetical protein [Qipengyuania proteolytica]MBX7494479.1 hypothetical protein [Qipengyuania proteolytica]